MTTQGRGEGLWFVEPAAIRQVAAEIAPEVVRLAARTRGWEAPEHVASFEQAYKIGPLQAADDLALQRDEAGLVGVVSFRHLTIEGEALLHLSNAAVRPELQRRQMMTRAVLEAIRRYRAKLALEGRSCRYVTGMTQSAAVYSTLAASGRVYPSVAGAAPPLVRQIARAIADTFNPGLAYDDELQVIRQECRFFFRDAPRSDDPAVNALFDRSISLEAGDVIVVVVDIGQLR